MRMPCLCLALLVLSSFLSIAQSSDSQSESEWRMFHSYVNHSGFTASSVPPSTLSWTFPTSATISSSPAVADGIVYFGSFNGVFYAVNASNGVQVWSFNTSRTRVRTSPAVAGGVVYFGTDGTVPNYLFALNASTGQYLWNYSVNSVYCGPAVSNGFVYFGALDWYVYALNASTGAFNWSTIIYSSIYYSNPAVVDDVVYISPHDSFLYALNATNGSIIWWSSTLVTIYSSPAVAKGIVYIGSDKVYAFNASTGLGIWNFSGTGSQFRSSPAYHEDVIYIGSQDNKVYALNATSGSEIWNYTMGNYPNLVSPAYAQGVVFIGAADGRVYALNASTGSQIWNYTTSGAISSSSPAVADGMLFIGSGQELYALGSTPHWNGALNSQLNVSQTCGSEINATALNFGSLVPGQTSGQQSLLLTNIGSWNTSDITIEGTDWISTPTINFTANYTKWSITDAFNYEDGTSTQNTPASLNFNLTNNQTQAAYFRVQIPLGQATATYTQNITITTIC